MISGTDRGNKCSPAKAISQCRVLRGRLAAVDEYSRYSAVGFCAELETVGLGIPQTLLRLRLDRDALECLLASRYANVDVCQRDSWFAGRIISIANSYCVVIKLLTAWDRLFDCFTSPC